MMRPLSLIRPLLLCLLLATSAEAASVHSGAGAAGFSDLSGSITDAQVPNTITVDRASTADALTSDPAGCPAGQYGTDTATSGVLVCAQPTFSQLSGTATDEQIPDTITVNRSVTADALTSNPDDCAAGQIATGISASGALSCTASPTVTTLNATTVNVGGTAISPSLTGTTAGIGGGALLAGGCASGTVAVTGSTTSMGVAVTPNTYPGDGTLYYGYVSTNGTVTVKVCAIVALTPVSSTYNVKVVQ